MVRGEGESILAVAILPPGKQLSMTMLLLSCMYALLGFQVGTSLFSGWMGVVLLLCIYNKVYSLVHTPFRLMGGPIW
jgi:hypothetical protein